MGAVQGIGRLAGRDCTRFLDQRCDHGVPFGNFVSAMLLPVAGLMAWPPTFRHMEVQGKKPPPVAGRVCVGATCAVLGLRVQSGTLKPTPPTEGAESPHVP